MSENLRLYQAAIYGMNAVVTRVEPVRWDEPSRCADWTCREVIGHAIWHTRALAAAVGNGDEPVAQAEAEVAGADPLPSWIDARDRVLQGLDHSGVLQRNVETPFGSMLLDDRLRLWAADIYTHTWDIAEALGMDPALDPAIAATILPGLLPMSDELRSPGMMGPQIDVGDDAPVVDRFLGFCGRDPSS